MSDAAEGRHAYSELQGQQIVATIRLLERRIAERFPDAGLRQVGARLAEVADATEADIAQLRRPLWIARAGAVIGIVGIIAVTEEVFRFGLPGSLAIGSLSDFLQAGEAAVNLVILFVLGIYFMVSLEARIKRRSALTALHRLRSIIHIVDMHQLTKDPEHAVVHVAGTASSPVRELSRFLLSRYLDYCSEMFSLTSKVAALYVQHLNDEVVLNAVNEIETLAASLSQKVWQKIMILNALNPEPWVVPPPQQSGSGA